MKIYSVFTQLLAIFILSTGVGLAQKGSVTGFEQLKSLEGEWQGVKSTDGGKVEISYKLTSGGSALVETINPVNEPSMVTVYHLDGDKLLMTHYCSAGNQPRMVADIPGSGPNKIDFKLLEVTNLSSSSAGHMNHLTFTFEDKDTMTQAWTFFQDGQEMFATFDLRRKK